MFRPHPHSVVKAIGSAVLVQSAGQITQNVGAGEVEVHFPLPGRFKESSPMRLVQHRDHATSAPDRLMHGDLLPDSTIAPPKPAYFFKECFMAARRGEGCSDNNILHMFISGKGLSNDDVRGARSTIFQEIRLAAGLKTSGFVEEVSGGLP